MSEEIWKPVLGFEGYYEVSNIGRVKSLARTIDNFYKFRPERILKSCLGTKGYCMFGLRRFGKTKLKLGHSLVLEAFVSPRPPGMDACHHNGIRHDNRLENLRWDTRRNNFADRDRHGTTQRGQIHYLSKFTDSDVISIRERHKSGLAGRTQMAREYGVAKTTIDRILARQSWKHL